MKIDLIVSALPPSIDGIGDYTARLAAEVAKSSNVRVLTASDRPFDPIAGVEVAPCFVPAIRRSVWGIADAVVRRRPDWVVLQFNQFSFGRWGLNPVLPLAIRSIARRSPQTRLGVMFHEDFVPTTTWKYRVMRTWQKWQFRSLGRAADAVMFSIDPWVRRYRSWFPDKPVLHAPVGSNIPEVDLPVLEARARLGIGDGAIVLSLFGTVHPARNVPWVRAAVAALRATGEDVVLLYIGANGDVVRACIGDCRIIADGPLEPDEVSRRLRAADIYLAPFSDGVSTRRTSMMSGLQHGIATVGTRGALTDELLEREHGRSLLLTDVGEPDEYGRAVRSLVHNPALRRQLAAGGAELYRREFDWPVIGRRFARALAGTMTAERSGGIACPATQEVAL